MARRKRPLILLLGSVLVLPVVTGCNGQAPPLTAQEKANFKGGPMPESARQMLQRRLHGMGGPGSGGPPPNANQPPNAGAATNSNANAGH